MQCRDVQNELVDCLYGEISADQRDALMAHVNQCRACGASWKALQDGRRMLDTLDREEEHPAVDVRRLFHTAAERAQRHRHRWKRLAAVCAAAAAVLCVVVLSRLQVELSQGQVVVAWGERPEANDETSAEALADSRMNDLLTAVERANARAEQQERQIADLAQRTLAIDELARLATSELLAAENRHVRELDHLRTALARSERATQAALKDLREQGNLRWKLTVHELSQRPALASIVDAPVSAQ